MELDLSSIQGYEQEIESAKTSDELYQVKVKYLGKKGLISGLNKQLKDVPNEHKKKISA